MSLSPHFSKHSCSPSVCVCIRCVYYVLCYMCAHARGGWGLVLWVFFNCFSPYVLRQSFAEPEIDLTNLTRQDGSKSQIPSVSASPSTHSTSADCMVWFSYGCQIPAQVFMSVWQSLHSPSHLLSHCFNPSLCLSSPPPLLHPPFLHPPPPLLFFPLFCHFLFPLLLTGVSKANFRHCIVHL